MYLKWFFTENTQIKVETNYFEGLKLNHEFLIRNLKFCSMNKQMKDFNFSHISKRNESQVIKNKVI